MGFWGGCVDKGQENFGDAKRLLLFQVYPDTPQRASAIQ